MSLLRFQDVMKINKIIKKRVKERKTPEKRQRELNARKIKLTHKTKENISQFSGETFRNTFLLFPNSL